MRPSLFLNKNIVSISPFPNVVDSGVSWRIQFVLVTYLAENSILSFFRLSDTFCEDTTNVLYGSSNKFFHLLDIRILYNIFKIRKKKNLFLYCHTIWSGFYGIFCKIFFGIPFFFDNHNVEFDRFKGTSKIPQIFIYFFEFLLLYASYRTVVSSVSDKRRIKQLYGFSNVEIIKNKFSSIKGHQKLAREETLNMLHLSSDKKIILFFGTFDYQPNLEALRFIESKISPFLDSGVFEIVVAGRCSQNLKTNSSNIKYLGFVDNLDSLILASDLVIAPIFSGAGVKIKVVHSLSHGKKVLTTSEGARGIDRHPNLFIADKDNFVNCILNFFS